MGLKPADINNRPALVLSVDGGGIRGIIPAVVLAAIRQGVGSDLHEVFDLISGTSTGGIIALGIGTDCNNGKPYSPSDLVQMYVDQGATIFNPSLFSFITRLWRPKYSAEPLEGVLKKFFGSTMLSAARTPLLISSYDLQKQIPFFFKSHRIPTDPTFNWPVWQAARCTSAAPTFFPPFHLQSGPPANLDYSLVDGGIYVNDPAMAAYAEARKVYPNAPSYLVLSVGTGDRQDKITYEQSRKWGLLQWATRISSVMMESVEDAVDYELWSMAGKNLTYFRLQVKDLSPAVPEMDDVSPQNLQALREVANKYVSENAAVVQTICKAIQQARGGS
jgi:hypothetical protein